ncbi:hypothetical protein OIU85_015033 [Salix viminalis]|uniref:Secreted protein n=1 Tax=Salix viminalis TaxID=40686 RepID=A0A9Q0NKA6_SALVM|nr:hypothetical protein OIU85_015033 [Salix viminalis]
MVACGHCRLSWFVVSFLGYWELEPLDVAFLHWWTLPMEQYLVPEIRAYPIRPSNGLTVVLSVAAGVKQCTSRLSPSNKSFR